MQAHQWHRVASKKTRNNRKENGRQWLRVTFDIAPLQMIPIVIAKAPHSCRLYLTTIRAAAAA
jgi:hypothetical protein